MFLLAVFHDPKGTNWTDFRLVLILAPKIT